MRRNLCAIRWPRAAASMLSITAALALNGCSKPGSVFRLPDLSGKAAADADDRDEARKREEALAGTRPSSKSSETGKAAIASESKEPTRSAGSVTSSKEPIRSTGPVTVDRSGLASSPPKSSATSLESAARNAQAARARAALEAPDIPTRAAGTGEIARRPADHDAVARTSEVAGASWNGGATKQRVAPASREQPAKSSNWYEQANRSGVDTASTASHGESAGTASLDADEASARKPAARDWATRVAAAPESHSPVKPAETRSNDHPSAAIRQSRFQVDRLMATARIHLTQGELFSAQRTALLAERIAAREEIAFTAEEEHPSDLVRLIDRELALMGKGAVASRRGTAEGPGNASRTFEEASNQFAAWRPADESKASALKVRTVADARDIDPVAAMDRKPFASKGPEIVPARGESGVRTPAAWTHSSDDAIGASEPAWNTDRSPVALSSAISSADDFPTSAGSGRIVPAVGEEGGANFADSNPLTVSSGASADTAPLFMPSINLPENASAPVAAEAGEKSLAVAGPLLPATTATQALDNVWEEELIPAADASSEGFGKSFWALTSGILAAGAVLFGVARRLRRAERGV